MKREKTLNKIFEEPIRCDIEYKTVESLLIGLGFEKTEGAGSRVKFEKNGEKFFCHKPHKKGRSALVRAAIRELQTTLKNTGDV